MLAKGDKSRLFPQKTCITYPTSYAPSDQHVARYNFVFMENVCAQMPVHSPSHLPPLI